MQNCEERSGMCNLDNESDDIIILKCIWFISQTSEENLQTLNYNRFCNIKDICSSPIISNDCYISHWQADGDCGYYGLLVTMVAESQRSLKVQKLKKCFILKQSFMSELTFYFLQFQHYKKHILITGHVVKKGQQVFVNFFREML